MAIKIYKKEWQVAIILLISSALTILIPLFIFSLADRIDDFPLGLLGISFLTMVTGVALISASVIYLIAIIIYVRYDKMQMTEYPNEENARPGLKPYQRSLIWTSALAFLTLTVLATMEYFTYILIGIVVISLVITLILYAVHFSRNRKIEKEVNNGK